MTLFCPDGYVPVREAIDRAASCWFPEQMAALETAVAGELAINNKPNDNVNALTPVEKLARALGGQPSISQGLQQQIQDVLIPAEHRLRNFLHQGILAAYYFGGLFDQGRHAVAHEFWATEEADRVLKSGTYWPFGKPRTWREQPPGHPLFFLELELAALLSDEPKLPPNPDVTNVLCSDEYDGRDDAITERIHNTRAEGGARNEGRDEETSQSSRRKSRPAFERARRVIEELYPNGVPDQATESNKKLCQRVSEKLKEDVSSDTILRAAGRRK